MSDFDLDKSRWYNAMKIALAAEGIQRDAKVISQRASIFARYPYDPVAGKTLADIEDDLHSALIAIQTAREEYSHATPTMVPAE